MMPPDSDHSRAKSGSSTATLALVVALLALGAAGFNWYRAEFASVGRPESACEAAAERWCYAHDMHEALARSDDCSKLCAGQAPTGDDFRTWVLASHGPNESDSWGNAECRACGARGARQRSLPPTPTPNEFELCVAKKLLSCLTTSGPR